MLPSVILVLMGASAPSLSIEVNTDAIQQYDHVIVRAIVTNHGETVLRFLGDPDAEVRYIRYEWKRTGGEWQSKQVRSGGPSDAPGIGPLLEPGADYAEYYSIQLADRRTQFIFDKPGAYQLRGVVESSAGKLVSKPVTIKVAARKERDLQRIDRAKGNLYYLGAHHLPHDGVPQQLRDLRDIGGNVGSGVESMVILENIRAGQVPLERDNVAKTLRQQLDGIDLELGLHVLGNFYDQQRDWKRLQQIVDALPYPTGRLVTWKYSLDLRRPAEFVPRARR